MKHSWSSSKGHDDFRFDVFLSFRWEDTLNGFVGSLYEALRQHHVRTLFIDHHGPSKGEKIEELLGAIERSEIFIPIFSKRYAECRSSLMETAKMVECGRLILPVFYDIEPREVRNQRGPFEIAFQNHEEDQELEKKKRVKEWRDALKEAGEIKGYDVQTEAEGQEQKLIPLIVRRVLDAVSKAPLDVAKYPVGLDSRVDHMMNLLDLEAYDVGMVGIHGMGGIGKTTVAKAFYNKISSRFEASCFISDVKEVAKEFNGLVSLQRQLISEVLNDKHASINNVSQGINLIKRRIHSKRILIVLDDVDDNNQLNALAGSRSWFSPRSRIIITTRDKHVLNVHKLKDRDIYELGKLDPRQSLKLFSFHAFGRAKPIEEFVDLSERVVSIADGLPLTLEVMGSLFFDKHSAEEWEDALERLQQDQHEDVHKRLKISYDGLDDTEKRIFLDIACFFNRKGKENAIYMWKDCEFYPTITIKVLLHKSLIKIDNNKNEFEMHDQIREMGRHIVSQHHRPELRSRLWNDDEILDVLQNCRATDNIEGITLNSEWYSPTTFLNVEAFEPMLRLRLLYVNAVDFDGKFGYIFRTLRWLQWHGCQLDSLPHDFNLENLVVLDLWRSNIKKLWDGQGSTSKIFNKLKVLNLAHCPNLIAVNFVNVPCLVRLVLDDCYSLKNFGDAIGHLKNLVFLSMKRCEWLKELPICIFQLSSLAFLILEGCTFFNTLPEQLGGLTSLKELNLRGTMIVSIPESFGCLTSLQILDARECIALDQLPSSLGNAKNLKHIYLDETMISELPDSIGLLENLEELKATQCGRLKYLPDSIGNAKNLKQLYIDATNIRELPESIGLLEKLEILKASFCERLKTLPAAMGRLKSLRHLSIEHTDIEELPESMAGLTDLTVISNFNKSWRPKSLK